MKKSGFTLIELLAVIVVLAIIALIAIPVITSVIDKAKVGALKDSGYGILDAGEMYLAKNMTEGINDTLEFICSNGKCINGEKEISYKGQIETGRIRIYSDSKIELCITDNKYSALKKVTDKEVQVEKGTCKYEELSYDVAALVSKDDYDKVTKELNDLKSLTNQTDATAEDLLEGKKAYSNGGIIIGSANFGSTFSSTTTSQGDGSSWVYGYNFNLSSIPDYQNKVLWENLFIRINSMGYGGGANWNYTYTPSTGNLYVGDKNNNSLTRLSITVFYY